MLFSEVVQASAAVTASSRRNDKVAVLAALLARTPPSAIELVVAVLSGTLPHGKTGIGSATLRAAREVAPSDVPTLTVAEVDEALSRLATTGGAGAASARASRLRSLLARATREEHEFLVRLFFGELRQGALEGLLLEAVARASQVPVERIRRAVMLAGAAPAVVRAVLTGGAAALAPFILQLMRPVQPMLADSAPDVAAALPATGSAAVEYKLDGARIQVHKADDEVRVFTRALNEVTSAVPEIVELVAALPARGLILDGEALVLRPDGAPQPFQVTMRRFGRRLDVAGMRAVLPLSPFFFDCLMTDGAPLIDEPLARRIAALDAVVPPPWVTPRRIASSVAEADQMAAASLAAGHEGVMVKALDAGYAAGRRGQAWIKVKPARTLDLVVLAAEWGSGRRRGWLSNLHLGARDAERGGFVMLGKTFKGLTDDLLRWQTAELLAREIGRDAYTVYVRPELVVEVAFSDVQESPHYPGRLALRFARVRRYRPDKGGASADTFAAVQGWYRQLTGLEPPGVPVGGSSQG